MTVNTDEIDLKPYVIDILRSWWQIALIAGLFSIGALFFTNLQTQHYEASATILLTRTRAVLALADQFPTQTEPVDTRSRMEALVTIASDDAIALKTYEELRDRLQSQGIEFNNFLTLVTVQNSGDAIQIIARANTPELVVDIANTWAENATSVLNQAYSGEQPLTELQAQLSIAKRDFEQNQVTLEGFIAQNDIELIKAQIDESREVLESMKDLRAWQILFYENRRRAMIQLEAQIVALKRQVEDGNASVAGLNGDALAVLMARTLALGRLQTSPGEGDSSIRDLTIDLNLAGFEAISDTPTNLAADLDNLIRHISEERIIVENLLIDLTQEITSEAGQATIATVIAKIRTLESELEALEAQQQDLISQRDLSREAYQALARKETEVKNTIRNEIYVTIVNKAIPPSEPVGGRTLLNIAIGTLLGMSVGVSVIIIRRWWRSIDH